MKLPGSVMTRLIAVATLVGTSAVAAPTLITTASAPASNSAATIAADEAGNATTVAADQADSSAKLGKLQRRLPRLLRRALVHEVSTLTGQSIDEIRSQLKAGKTLSAIAGSQAAAAKDAVVQKLTQRLNKAVSNGKISKTQESAILKRVDTLIDKLMNTVFKPKQDAKGNQGAAA